MFFVFPQIFFFWFNPAVTIVGRPCYNSLGRDLAQRCRYNKHPPPPPDGLNQLHLAGGHLPKYCTYISKQPLCCWILMAESYITKPLCSEDRYERHWNAILHIRPVGTGSILLSALKRDGSELLDHVPLCWLVFTTAYKTQATHHPPRSS